MVKKAQISREDIHKKVFDKLSKAGKKGATFSTRLELKNDALYKNVLDSLTQSGTIVQALHNGKEAFFLKEFLPSDPYLLATDFLTKKFSESPVWIPNLLKIPKGTVFKQIHLDEGLSKWENQGVLQKIDLKVNSKSTKEAYLYRGDARQTFNPPVQTHEELNWSKIEQKAREIAAQDFAQVVTFEKLAHNLGVPPIILHRAFQQKQPTNMVLLPGTPTPIQDFDGSALTHEGQKYACFSFRD